MRIVVRVSLSALLLALAAGAALACSQCICGTPFPAAVMGGVIPSQFTYGLEERYLSKTNALEEAPGSEHEREHRISAFGSWRPQDHFALIARLPYNRKEITAEPIGDVSETESASGLGDAELLALIGVRHGDGSHALSLGLVAGATAPTGSNDAQDDTGARLDAHLQPGSGAWSGLGGVNLALGAGGGFWEASLLGRVNGTSSQGYRYGNAALYNVGYVTPQWHTLRFLAQLNGRFAARDRMEDGTDGENTGGSVMYVAPGVRWTSPVGLALEAEVQVPAAQSLNGEQEEHTTARLSLSLAH